MAPKSLKDYLWKMSLIVEVWRGWGWLETTEGAAEKYTKKFTKILKEKFDIDNEETNPYKSESPDGRAGQYIFGGNNAPKIMKELFDLVDENEYITEDERKKMCGYLKALLPPFRTVKECEEAYKETSEQIKKFGIIPLKFEESDLSGYWEKVDIDNMVEKYYIKTRTVGFFEDRVFWKADTNQIKKPDIQEAIYRYEKELVDYWAEKWKWIMDEAIRIRKVERFDNGYEKCFELGIAKEDRKEIYEKGIWNETELEELCEDKNWISSGKLCRYLCLKHEEMEIKIPIYGSKDAGEDIGKEKCLDSCEESIKNILRHPLRNVHKKDFAYMKGQAFRELESVRIEMEKIQKGEIYKSETGEGKTDKLDELNNIREIIETMNESRISF